MKVIIKDAVFMRKNIILYCNNILLNAFDRWYKVYGIKIPILSNSVQYTPKYVLIKISMNYQNLFVIYFSLDIAVIAIVERKQRPAVTSFKEHRVSWATSRN